MGDLHVRRLPVLNRDKRLVGIVSLGDLALSKPKSAGDALQSIAEAPGGRHASPPKRNDSPHSRKHT